MNILYIEDEPADVDLVERFTKMMNHELNVIDNLADFSKALESVPDLILVDIVIEESRAGYRLAQDLRAQGYTQPMIAITGLALPQDIQRCYDAGFTEVLTKPYDVHRLIGLLQKYTI